LAQWITDIDHLYAGGKDKETWEPKAVRSYVDWTIDFADADHDGKMSRCACERDGAGLRARDMQQVYVREICSRLAGYRNHLRMII